MVVKMVPIIPKKQFTAEQMTSAINDALSSTLKEGQRQFKSTTKSWSNPVEFSIDGPTDGSGAVGTDDEIYGYVTHGTAPHLITPRNASVLAFEAGTYRAKSQPGVLGSRSVGAGTRGTGGVGQAVFTKSVNHPGIEARQFEETVAARLQPVLTTKVTAAILKVTG